jgi:NaMN:DMB phosphoribosyltransferase
LLINKRRKTSGDRQMLKLRYLLIPLGAVATIAALSAQTASHATTREPAVAMTSEQLVTCTDENRKTLDICLVADSLSH